MARIVDLRSTFGITSPLKIFDLRNAGARDALRDFTKQHGGVYVLFSTVIGLFYVGSAVSFLSNKIRLNVYFQPARVANSVSGKSTKVSKRLALDITANDILSFVIIPVEMCPTDQLTIFLTRKLEQT
jgi:hypothetical protein